MRFGYLPVIRQRTHTGLAMNGMATVSQRLLAANLHSIVCEPIRAQ
jgi:hypothetical protein